MLLSVRDFNNVSYQGQLFQRWILWLWRGEKIFPMNFVWFVMKGMFFHTGVEMLMYVLSSSTKAMTERGCLSHWLLNMWRLKHALFEDFSCFKYIFIHLSTQIFFPGSSISGRSKALKSHLVTRGWGIANNHISATCETWHWEVSWVTEDQTKDPRASKWG
jgi:hypothetical protein